MKTSAIIGERYVSKVGAVFASAEDARRAADAVVTRADVARSEVRLIEPGDSSDRESHKLEPETRGIARTLVRAHITLGIAGAVCGAVLGGLLLLTGVGAFTSNPWITLGWLTAFGAVGGLLLGGFVALRPDHDALNLKVEEATRDGHHWAVVVHVRDHDHERQAREVLEEMSGEVIATL